MRKTTMMIVHPNVLLLLAVYISFLLLAFVNVTVDASNFGRNSGGKNLLLHEIAKGECGRDAGGDDRDRAAADEFRKLDPDENNIFGRNETELQEPQPTATSTPTAVVDGDGDGDVHESVVYGTIWKSTNDRMSPTSRQIAVSIISSQSQDEDSSESEAELCQWLREVDGFDVLDCRSYSISGYLDVCSATTLGMVEGREDVVAITPTYQGQTSTSGSGDRFTGSGTVKSQAISALQITSLLHKYPQLTGKNFKIGIISDSFNVAGNTTTTEADDILTGNLPSESDGNKVILLDDDPTRGIGKFPIDEGRAMAQLIYDLIPDAQMYFYSALVPTPFFSEAIEALVEAGCDIIVDDIRILEEPVYQLGFTAQAAEAAVKQGVPYFSAAGNKAANSYETTYKRTPCNCDQVDPPNCLDKRSFEFDYESCLDFGNGSDRQFIEVEAGVFNVTLYWDQAWGSISGPPGAENDFDFFLFNNTDGNNTRIGVSAIFNFPGGNAFEELVIEFPGSYYFSIAEFDTGFDPTGLLIKWISWGSSTGLIADPVADTPTLTGTANAPSVAAVAAAFDQQTFGQIVQEPFTALGGIPLLFDTDGSRFPAPIIFDQPRFTGPDGSFTTFFGRAGKGLTANDKIGFTPQRFFGTSAAAPNVAAVGIILLQACALFRKDGNRRRLEIDNSSSGSGRVLKREKSLKSKSKISKKKGTKKITASPTRIPPPPFDCSLPANIYKILEKTAIDMNNPGYDFFTGNGFVNAVAAVEKLIELVNDPFAAEDFVMEGVQPEPEPGDVMRQLNDEDKKEQRKQCPIESFLYPVTSFFDEIDELVLPI